MGILFRMNSCSNAPPCDAEVLLLTVGRQSLDGEEVYRVWENKVIYAINF